MKRYGACAVVTGAARGIGKAFAIELAAAGMQLILIDILPQELQDTAAELKSTYNISVIAVEADLGAKEGVDKVLQIIADHEIGLFCCNHASTHLFADGKLREWVDISTEELNAMVHINITAAVAMVHSVANAMRKRGKGGIVLVSSGSALSGSPYLSQYAATKAFLANLGETLWWELGKYGIDVVTVFPGATNTPGAIKFFSLEGKQKIPMMTPEAVAKESLAGLGKKMQVIPGFMNKVQTLVTTRLLPRKIWLFCFGKMFSRFLNVKEPQIAKNTEPSSL